MRKIIALSFITIDGVMQAPGGPEEDTSGGFKFGGWTFPYFNESLDKIMSEQMKPADLLLGRKTFEIFASYWPGRADNWPGINEVTKYVVSKSLKKHGWSNSVFLKNIQEVKKLKKQKGSDLKVFGSEELMQGLLKNDLVDELWLKIFPITLGKGKRLFADGTIPAAFKLIKAFVSSNGVIVANYKRDGEVKTGSF